MKLLQGELNRSINPLKLFASLSQADFLNFFVDFLAVACFFFSYPQARFLSIIEMFSVHIHDLNIISYFCCCCLSLFLQFLRRFCFCCTVVYIAILTSTQHELMSAGIYISLTCDTFITSACFNIFIKRAGDRTM